MSSACVGSLRQRLLAVGLQFRALCAVAWPAELYATQIKLRRDQVLEVEFNTGQRFTYPAEYLRVESPAAGNQDSKDARGQLKVVHGRRQVGIMAIDRIGSYAVRLSFDDLHSSGIYSWQYLHDLGTQKLSRMRRYIRMLRERGLSRDPPRRRTATAACKSRTEPSRAGAQQAGASSGGSSSSGGGAGSSSGRGG